MHHSVVVDCCRARGTREALQLTVGHRKHQISPVIVAWIVQRYLHCPFCMVKVKSNALAIAGSIATVACTAGEPASWQYAAWAGSFRCPALLMTRKVERL